jgi:hypothetical protein
VPFILLASYARIHLLRPNLEGKLILLKVASKFVPIFLLIWLLVSPAMACLVPTAQLTPAEMACCRNMAGMCDEMGKTSSHSCCAKVQTHIPSFLILTAGHSSTQPQQSDLPRTAVTRLTIPFLVASAFIPAEYGYPPGHSPPNVPDIIAFRA